MRSFRCTSRGSGSWATAAILLACFATYAAVWTAAKTPPAVQGIRRPAAEQWQDRIGDGVPEFLRLDSPADRDAFRRWFTLIGEFQALRPPSQTPPEITDCSALLRYSYRNALRRHDAAWIRETGIVPPSALGAIEKYQYPLTPVGAALFRVLPGPLRPNDIQKGAFAEFADANTLRSFNTYFVSRDVSAARRGDILFFRQLEQNSPFHSMIFVGPSQWMTDGPESSIDVLVYDTGPIGKQPGEMRRVSMKDLLAYPSPRWRPLPGNGNFLGVYRWNILRGES